MTKLFIVFLVSALCSLTGYCQDSVLFKLHFQPGRVYQQVYSQKTKMTLTYDTASKQVIKILEDKGVRNPTISTIESLIRSETTVEGPGPKNRTGLMTRFLEINNPSLKASGPTSATMTGSVARDSLPVLDSLISAELDGGARKTIRSILQNMYTQIRTPDRKMAIGGVFSQTYPVTIPVGGIFIDLVFTTVFTLKELSPNAARFSLAVKYSVPKKGGSAVELPISGQGKGTGELLYDRKNEFPVKWTMNSDILLHIDNPGFSMDLALDGQSSFDCTLSEK